MRRISPHEFYEGMRLHPLNPLGRFRRLFEGIENPSMPALSLENALCAIRDYEDKKIVVSSRPFMYNFELTNHCNLTCPLCPTGKRDPAVPRGFMDTGLYREIVEEVADHAVVIGLVNWGESTLHPDLIQCIRQASGRGLNTYLSSNFSLEYPDRFFDELIDSGLSILHLDLDGMSAETYEHYRRGASYERFRGNLTRFMKRNRDHKVKVELSLLAMRHNEHEIPAFRDFCAEEPGVDWSYIGKIQINPGTSLEWLPENPGYRYNNYLDGSVNVDCNRCYFSMVVNWDGMVAPCCLCYGEAANIGDANKNSLAEIWNNAAFQSIRALFKGENSEPKTMCHLCRNQLGSKKIPRFRDTMAISVNSL